MNLKKINKVEVVKDISIILSGAILVLLISTNFIRFSTVIGHSMDNNLYDGERLIIKLFEVIPKKGDIIVAERKDLSIRYFIKRVIAIEDDTLEIKNNVVYLNGEILEEDYIKEDMFTEDYPLTTIPKGKIFVMGDNRNNSIDSRNEIIGLVDIEEELVGKAIFTISKWKKF